MKEFIGREFFLLIPVIYFLVVMSFFYQTQCGIRHIIFIYPFMFILSGAIIKRLKTLYSKIIVTALGLFLVISVIRYWGNYFPYTNEFIRDKKTAWRYVGAGNLEFHQGGYFITDYFKKHPGTKWAPTEPAAGIFVIDTEDYLDIWNRHRYDWIRQYKPSGHVAFNYLLIEVKETDLPH